MSKLQLMTALRDHVRGLGNSRLEGEWSVLWAVTDEGLPAAIL